ncbi:hypothetical protein EVAR_53339_1 [Eumeta japonica]|uniref:Uncharacterized protein n=1 Tax=Eumeta variegata TaxID=151549 RepID=A0A4C1XA89_EUMVA|nr:hypothetical protein EVAR_53339_1 [Eumeta japonica]
METEAVNLSQSKIKNASAPNAIRPRRQIVKQLPSGGPVSRRPRCDANTDAAPPICGAQVCSVTQRRVFVVA